MSTVAIFNKLVSANHLKHIKLNIEEDEEVNAYSLDGVITMNTGMMLSLRNSDEMAKVLSHEMGHAILGHKESIPANEFAADKLGAKLMRNTEYDVCHGAQYLKRRDDGWSETHPADIDRYHALGC